MSDDFEIEIKNDFLIEAEQNLDDCESSFMELESDPHNEKILQQIFRLAHNLKGASRAVGFGDVAEFTHHLENLVLYITEGKIEPTEEVITVLLESNDCIKVMVSGLKQNLDATFDNSAGIDRIQKALEGNLGGATPTVDTNLESLKSEVATEVDGSSEMMMTEEALVEGPLEVPMDFDENDFPEETVEEAGAVEPEVPLEESCSHQDQEMRDTDAVTVEKSMSFSESQSEPQVQKKKEVHSGSNPSAPGDSGSKGGKSSKNTGIDEVVRVSMSRLDKLNNLVGELVILQSMLQQHQAINSTAQGAKDLGMLGKLSKEIHEVSMSLRMVPVKTTLQKLHRIVRDTSKTLGKSIELKLTGEETEIDKTVLEQIVDPLVHIVRNAVDHGVETPDVRSAAGKPPEGQVEIKCFHEGDSLVIEVIDDGKGVDPKVIRRKAIERGLINEDSNIEDNELIQFLFHSGFSTKDEVSEVSGRGVGMDVVKTNIEKMNGKVNLTSKLGEGSICRISLPLTMAVIEAFIGEVSGEKFVFPLVQVDETVQIKDSEIDKVSGMGEVLNLRGKSLPLYRLENILNLKPKEGAVVGEERAIIISKHHGTEFGVLIDDLISQQQIVVKSLGKEVNAQKGFMGSSILGNGRPALIIDLHKMFSKQGAA